MIPRLTLAVVLHLATPAGRTPRPLPAQITPIHSGRIYAVTR